jgi:hypothetical protein
MLPLCLPNLFSQPESPLLAEPTPTCDGRTVTLRIPISIRRRGGRKLVLAPDGTPNTGAALSRRIDSDRGKRARQRRGQGNRPGAPRLPSFDPLMHASNQCF